MTTTPNIFTHGNAQWGLSVSLTGQGSGDHSRNDREDECDGGEPENLARKRPAARRYHRVVLGQHDRPIAQLPPAKNTGPVVTLVASGCWLCSNSAPASPSPILNRFKQARERGNRRGT